MKPELKQTTTSANREQKQKCNDGDVQRPQGYCKTSGGRADPLVNVYGLATVPVPGRWLFLGLTLNGKPGRGFSLPRGVGGSACVNAFVFRVGVPDDKRRRALVLVHLEVP